MSLRIAVAAPFAQAGTQTLRENEFVVALSLDRDWFSPDQAKRLVDVGTEEGLLTREDDELRLGIDAGEVRIPDEFVPGEDLLRGRSTFERVLDAVVAEGSTKRAAVGEINALQQELAISIEAAAIVYARREGVDVSGLVAEAREAIIDEG